MKPDFLQSTNLRTVLTTGRYIDMWHITENQLEHKFDFRCNAAISGAMPPPLKVCDTAVDYSAFMLAMVFARHSVDLTNVDQQWSAEILAENNNGMEYSNSANFAIDSSALKHGMTLFTSALKKRSIDRIEIYKSESSPREFFSLRPSVCSYEIKFPSYFTPPKYTVVELLVELKTIRDQILKQCNYEPSIHHSPAAVYGCLYYPTICGLPNDSKTVKNEIIEVTNSPTTGFRIISKSPQRRSNRSIKRTVGKIMKYVEDHVGEKHALFYLQSAIKKR